MPHINVISPTLLVSDREEGCKNPLSNNMGSVNIYRVALILTLVMSSYQSYSQILIFVSNQKNQVLVVLDTAGNVVLILFPTCNLSVPAPATGSDPEASTFDATLLTLGDFFYGIYLSAPSGNCSLDTTGRILE